MNHMKRGLAGVVMGLTLAMAVYAQEYAGLTVGEVAVSGLTRASEQLVRSQIEVSPGDVLQQQAVARDLRRLYDLGFFATIRVDAQQRGNLVDLTYIFEEKQVIESLRITGNDRVRTRQIRGALTWREGDSFVPEAYAGEIEAIRSLYESKGFPSAAIDIAVEEVAAGRVRVTYTVVEGQRARIRSIDFEGNETLSNRELRGLMQTKRAWWFLGGRYDEAQFEEDLERIVERYGDFGRLEAAVEGAEFTYNETGKKMRINIAVEEGPEYSVGSLRVAGNIVFDDDEVRRIIEVHEGEVHNASQVAADAELVQKGYTDSGYVDAQVAPQVTIDRDTQTTNVVHRINEGSLKYVREIKISGNNITKDSVIRRNIFLSPGDRFDGSLIRFSQRSLENLDYFDATRFTVQPVSGLERYSNLLLDVQEAETGEFGFGAGFNTDTGVGGFVELSLRNFDATNWPTFSGGGQSFSARFEVGDDLNQFNISFGDPEFLGYPLAFGVNVFSQEQDFRGADFTSDARGAGIQFGKSLSPLVNTRFGLQVEDIDVTDVPVFAIEELRDLFSDEGSTNALFWSITRNTLDSRRDPSRGYTATLSLELAGAGDHEFYRIDTDTWWFYPLGDEERWIASWRGRLGWVNDYGEPGFVSLVDRYYLGGGATLRGYDTRDVGPQLRRFGFFGEEFRVGGELRAISNVEMKYKLTEQVRFYTFFDSGGLWPEAGDIDLGEVRYSVGIGVGVEVPRLGPIRIDYGIPLNADEDQGSGQLHFQTGFRF